MQELIIDGHSFAIAFEGFAQPLRTRIESTGESLEVALPPWPCARHLDGLRRHLYLDGERLALDAAGYADEMLAWAEVPAPLRERLRPLALWWALGRAPSLDNGTETSPDAGPVGVPDAEGWVTLGPGLRARLRPWTWGERLAAQRAQLADTADGLDFDAVAYLERMLAACVQRIENAAGDVVALEALDPAAARTLMAAVTALNHPDRQATAPLAELPPLLDAAEGYGAHGAGRLSLRPAVPVPAPPKHKAATAPARPRIADHPDAVVILFGNDEDEP